MSGQVALEFLPEGGGPRDMSHEPAGSVILSGATVGSEVKGSRLGAPPCTEADEDIPLLHKARSEYEALPGVQG